LKAKVEDCHDFSQNPFQVSSGGLEQMYKFRPKEKLEFWCNVCDSSIVNSEDNSSGQFYVVSGMNLNSLNSDESVVFALCSTCRAVNLKI
jgi:hypothetical protein